MSSLSRGNDHRAMICGMSALQSLVGAMGLASWRCRERLVDHATVAPASAVITHSGQSLAVQQSSVLGLHEVGITDLVMATIWRHGPRAVAYGVSSHAEARHLGADIAILHRRSRRILLYQAKLGHIAGDQLTLKSEVSGSQLKLLNRKRVTLSGIVYRVGGRLAIYQIEPSRLSRCENGLPLSGLCKSLPMFMSPLWRGIGPPSNRPPSGLGREYYNTCLLLHQCSPCGILASPVPRPGKPLSFVARSHTWPWEFDVYDWLDSDRPSDRLPNDGTAGDPDFLDYYPDFADYYADPEDATVGEVDELVEELTQRLRLPQSQRLYLIVLP